MVRLLAEMAQSHVLLSILYGDIARTFVRPKDLGLYALE